jgi:hypothetical protein
VRRDHRTAQVVLLIGLEPPPEASARPAPVVSDEHRAAVRIGAASTTADELRGLAGE